MGQYWTPYLIKETHDFHDAKGELYVVLRRVALKLEPHKFDNGAKLMEHSYLGNELVEAVMAFLADSAANPPTPGSADLPEPGCAWPEFKGFRVAWVGDYATEDHYLDHGVKGPKGMVATLRKAVEATPSAIAPGVLRGRLAHPADGGAPYVSVILVCDDREEFLDMEEYRSRAIALRKREGRCKGEETSMIPHPLPLLTALCNGLGGGDYDGINMNAVGSWSFRKVRAVLSREAVPEGYKDVSDPFEERYVCQNGSN